MSRNMEGNRADMPLVEFDNVADFAANAALAPCRDTSLNGSWYLQLTPRGPHNFIEIRGPMRIEAAPIGLRISGDIYVNRTSSSNGPIEILRPIPENTQLFGSNWYPHLPRDQYSWYFRSLGATYSAGKLVFNLERRLWDSITKEFINPLNVAPSMDFIELNCSAGNIFNHPLLPQPTLRMSGTAQIGNETYDVVATKTSPYYRGCLIEVDIMINRSFPASATTFEGSVITFESLFRTAGIDCPVGIDLTNLPSDPELTSVELQIALEFNKAATTDNAWRLWLLVGSTHMRYFGLMFDEVEPARQGTAVFFDEKLGNENKITLSARNKKIGEVPQAFLRTLVHEVGHAFNLVHPSEDVHHNQRGTTIMNQTGDVIDRATGTQLFPDNIAYVFDDHCRTSLIHSPDPQIAPSWKPYRWGHGRLSSGVGEPADAAGLSRNEPVSTELSLELVLPENVFRGEFVTAQFKLTNKGSAPSAISTAFNLSMGDMKLLVKHQAGELCDVTDIMLCCGERPMVILDPDHPLLGNAQIFYTNVGHTFRRTGRYYVSAELQIGDTHGTTVRSNLVTVIVRAPGTEEEQAIASLTMDSGVGRAFALGDFGNDKNTEAKFKILATRYSHTETGAAAALTLANSHGRDLRDLYTGAPLRKADQALAETNFGLAVKYHSKIIGRLAAAVVASTEYDAPLIRQTTSYLESGITAASLVGSVEAIKDISYAQEALDMLGKFRRSLSK